MSLEKEKTTGNKIHFTEIGKALKKLGHKVILVAPYYKSTGTRESYGLVDEQIFFEKKDAFSYMKFHGILPRKLKELIKEYNPDFVYSRDILNARKIKRILKKNNLKYYVEINNLLRRKEFKPYIAKKFLEHSQKNQILSADILRVMTSEQKKMIAQDYGVSESKINVIRHGTNPDIFYDRGKEVCRNKLSIDSEKFVFCFVGTFNYMEYIIGLKCFFRAYKIFIQTQIEETELLLIGDGRHRYILEQYADELGIKKYIKFAGMIDNLEVPDYISAADICLQVWVPEDKKAEGLSLKVSSYLACERRIIASEIPGFKEVLSPFLPLFWKLEDDESMKKSLFRAYRERKVWNYGEKQRKYVLSSFTWGISAGEIVRTFKEIK